VDPVPDSLLHRKSVREGNRARTFEFVARNSLDHKGGLGIYIFIGKAIHVTSRGGQ
jgi:hypothetical protein